MLNSVQACVRSLGTVRSDRLAFRLPSDWQQLAASKVPTSGPLGAPYLGRVCNIAPVPAK